MANPLLYGLLLNDQVVLEHPFRKLTPPFVVLSAHLQLHEVMPDVDFLSETDLICDVVCLVYDVNDPRSFEYCAKVYKVRTLNVPDDGNVTRLI